jgi:hypothetical protein
LTVIGFIVVTNALIDMGKCFNVPTPPPPPFPFGCGDTPPKSIDHCDEIPGGLIKKVRVSWDYPEDKILELGDTLHFHPLPWCRMIAKSIGYDNALEHLRKYLHQRIDQRFNGIKK